MIFFLPETSTLQHHTKATPSCCFQSLKIDTDKVYWCMCLSVCGFLVIDSSETIEAIIIKLGMVTASDMVMHQVLIILTLTFIQGHRDLNHD